ncbi:DNA-processing protein DprA [uncultured Croceitalea sp.]|uniref:DNA-processing protein DprA n=1 Tax=uncultured Croceitalea sp. TaxID=1798908 RepID=UPI00374F7B2B
MSENELIALLRLQRIPNIGDINAKKLLDRCGSAIAIFEEKKQNLLKIDGIGTYALQNLNDSEYLDAAYDEFNFISKNKIAYSYFLDEDYPRHLKHCIDSPILLFKSGNIDLKERRIISIVGTRKITSYGQAFCEEFIAEIALLNPIIVSGFAYGVDITIQRAAAEHGLQTIGCLAHGLNQVYPKAHKKHVSQIEKNGGFLTEFWSSSNPDRENFLKRNRVIAGMGEATIVVESAEKGGSLVTADIAHSYNRDVFAVPGRTSDKYSKGCNNLIKQQKAQLLTSAAELVYLLGWELDEQQKEPVQKQLFVELDETEQSIYSYLQHNGKQLLDTVALECNLPIFKVSATLLNMEMKGVVRPLPGKLFEAV